ncbi:MAG: hypothetical protein KL787_01705 [Taibaiella sp.]|nr:hypothetical protein [Taibaiella sp.]
MSGYPITCGKTGKKVIPEIVRNLEMTLAKIGMANVRIKIELQASENFNQFGKDELDFLMDANQSGHFNPMAKVASGGELSRLLLAIKSLVSENLSLPTLIFDEVDSAISGEAAKTGLRIDAVPGAKASGDRLDAPGANGSKRKFTFIYF